MTGDSLAREGRCWKDSLQVYLLGPMINVYPGDNLTIELFNNLHQPLLRQRGVHNFYHDFEWTNVHTHRRCPPSPVPKQSLPCAESI